MKHTANIYILSEIKVQKLSLELYLFKKVHFGTQRLHIGTLVVHLST